MDRIKFSPEKVGLESAKEVFVVLVNKNSNAKYNMFKDESGNFIYEVPKEKYTNYYYIVDGKYYYTHKIEFAVVATMSSGKTTFINAVLGDEILPSENQACTNRVFKIENSIDNKSPRVSVKREGERRAQNYELSDLNLSELNNQENIEEISIIKKFNNIDIPMTIHDTPGVNNSMNSEHAKKTQDFIKNSKVKNFVYFINATQIAVNDDKYFMDEIKELSRYRKINIIFVLNKIDELKNDTENVEEVVKNTENYIRSNEIEEFLIIPLSAYWALILRKVLNNKSLSRNERLSFEKYYELNKVEIEVEQDDIIEVGNGKYCKNTLLSLLDKTGINQLEEAMSDINRFSSSFLIKTV